MSNIAGWKLKEARTHLEIYWGRPGNRIICCNQNFLPPRWRIWEEWGTWQSHVEFRSARGLGSQHDILFGLQAVSFRTVIPKSLSVERYRYRLKKSSDFRTVFLLRNFEGFEISYKLTNVIIIIITIIIIIINCNWVVTRWHIITIVTFLLLFLFNCIEKIARSSVEV